MDRPHKLPITLLSGFLGAGKTTLLRHILQKQHDKQTTEESNTFRCAVIVNDMAQLNIDKALIEDSSLVQSDKIISMQNGCVCCDLKDDLVGQIVDMAKSGNFDYMIIEASGVSEPSQISQIFAKQEECQMDHDHEEAHGDIETLYDLTRLDTCVTVVDCHEFFAHMGTQRNRLVQLANNGSTWNTAKLMAEQIEFANVVILNKTDLVLPEQLQQIQLQIKAMAPKARTLLTSQSKPLQDIMDVVDTRLFVAKDFDFDSIDDLYNVQEQTTSGRMEEDKPSCCDTDARSMPFSGKSQIILGSSTSVSDEPTSKRRRTVTRHETRFAVTSFLYTSRLPFHSEKFRNNFMLKYFVVPPNVEEEEEHNENNPMSEEKDETSAAEMEDLRETLEELQVEAAAKKTIRSEAFGGQLLRSKGFVWLSNMHDLKMSWGQAGSMGTVEGGVKWNILKPEAWSSKDADLQKQLRATCEGPFGDRRQELVFIGIGVQPTKMQQALDDCLLTQEQYDMGVDGWKASYGDSFLDGI